MGESLRLLIQETEKRIVITVESGEEILLEEPQGSCGICMMA